MMGTKKTPPKKEPAAPVGRPSIYVDDLADEICARLAQGEALSRICLDPYMPGLTTIYRWLRENEPFRQSYARAKEDAADTMVSRIHEIVEEPPERDATGKVDTGWVQHQRLRVDTLKWQASKLKPKAYGDKLETTLKGDAEAPIQVATKVVIVPQKETAQIETKPLQPEGK